MHKNHVGRTRSFRLAPGLLAAAGLLGLAGCGSSGDEVWQFTLEREDGTTTAATAACRSDGSCDAGSWQLAADCPAALNFAVHFAGSAVALNGFRLAASGGACGPSLPRADSAGTGQTDAPFPEGRSAEGDVRLGFAGVFYVPGAPLPLHWHARRIS